MDLLGPQGHPPDGPESPNPDPDREIRFFENPDFSFFRLFKLNKDHGQLGMGGQVRVVSLDSSPYAICHI